MREKEKNELWEFLYLGGKLQNLLLFGLYNLHKIRKSVSQLLRVSLTNRQGNLTAEKMMLKGVLEITEKS